MTCEQENNAADATQWIKCTDWDDLPNGEWIVKIENSRNAYHIATATKTHNSNRIVIVGGHYSFARERIIAYTTFDRYEP